MAEHSYRLSDTEPENSKDPIKKSFTLRDHGNRYPVYKAENPGKNIVLLYHIDGDVIRDNGIQKCDYLLQNKTQGKRVSG
jgi:hypothetical protein